MRLLQGFTLTQSDQGTRTRDRMPKGGAVASSRPVAALWTLQHVLPWVPAQPPVGDGTSTTANRGPLTKCKPAQAKGATYHCTNSDQPGTGKEYRIATGRRSGVKGGRERAWGAAGRFHAARSPLGLQLCHGQTLSKRHVNVCAVACLASVHLCAALSASLGPGCHVDGSTSAAGQASRDNRKQMLSVNQGPRSCCVTGEWPGLQYAGNSCTQSQPWVTWDTADTGRGDGLPWAGRVTTDCEGWDCCCTVSIIFNWALSPATCF